MRFVRGPGFHDVQHRVADARPTARMRIMQLRGTGSIKEQARDFNEHFPRTKRQGGIDGRGRLRRPAAARAALHVAMKTKDRL